MPEIEVTPDLVRSIKDLGTTLPWLLAFAFMVLARKEVFAFLTALRSDNVANANLGRIAATLDRILEVTVESRGIMETQNDKFTENMNMFLTTNGALASMGTLFQQMLATLQAILAALTAGARR